MTSTFTLFMASYFRWLRLNPILPVAWSFGAQLVLFFYTFYTPVVLFNMPDARDLQVSQYIVSVESSSLILHRSYPWCVFPYVASLID